MNTSRWLGLAVLVTVSLAGPRAWATVTSSPDPIALGSVDVGTTAGASGNLSTDQATETIATFDLSACTSEFMVTTATPFVLVNGTARAVNVSITPAARGLRSCTVTMRDGLNTAIGTFQITGTGLAAELTITTPAPVDFGSVRVTTGATSTKNITLKNSGDAGHNLNITALAVSGTAAADYTITSPATLPKTIAPGSTLNVTIVFDPSAAGTRAASLDVTSDDPVTPMQSELLTGTGTNAVIAVSDVDFGVVPDNTAVGGTINVTNSAATFPGTLKVTSASIDTTSSLWFTFTAGNGCTGGSTSCNFTAQTAPLAVGVQCKPPTGSIGTQTTTVTFTSDSDAGGDSSALLMCTAGKPIIMVSTTAIAFGNQLVNTTSAAMSFTVSNTGNEDLTFYLAETGTDTASFAESTMSGCGTSSSNKCTVTAGNSVAVGVTFSPTTPGNKSATVQVISNDTTTPTANVALTGHATAPQIMPSASPLAFGTVEVNKSSTMTLTVTNSGDATLTISNAGIVAGGSADYTITNGLTGTQTTPIAPGGTASWDIKCAPSSYGPRPATAFRVTSDAFSTPTLNVSLTCTGLQGVLVVTPATTAFSGVRIGDVVTQTFTLSNPGNTAVNNITQMFDNTMVGYSITSPSFPIASLAANGGSTTITVQFAPMASTDGGNHNVTFTGSWGAGNAQTAMVSEAVTGTALVAGYDTVPSQTQSLDFGTIRYDQTLTKTVQIINTVPPPDTTTTVKILTIGITPQMAMTGEFSIVGCSHNGTAVTCPTATNPFPLVGANDTLVVSIKCAPANRVATLTGTFDIHSDLGTNPDRHVPLTATSTSATLALQPGMVLDFGPTDIDAGTVTQTITVQNMGTAPLTLGATTPSCTAPCPYAFSATGAQSVAPGGMFTVNVQYTPALEKPGPCPGANCDVASITWPYSGVCGGGSTCMGPSTVTVMIQGRGIDRHIVASPAPVFPDTFRNPGTAAPVMPVTIMNTGEATLHVSAAMLSNDPIWQLLDTAPVDVPGHGMFDFHVKFSPTMAGKAPDGQLVIMDNDNGMPMVMVVLQGNGINRNVEMAPNVINLGYTGVGIPVHLSVIAPNDLMQVTSLDATNTFTIRSIDIDGGNGAFTIDGSPSNVTLAPSSSQQFDVTFTPNAEGDFNATAYLYLDMDPTPQAMVMLQGHAVFADARGGGGCQTGRGSGTGALVIVGAMIFALRRRRTGGALLALVTVVTLGRIARADERDLDLTVFNPTPATTGSMFQLQDAQVGEDGAWVVSALASYANDPLVIDTVQNTDAAVQTRTMLGLGGSYAFLGRFEAGARMPLYIQSGQTVNQQMSFGVPPAGGTSRGDLTLHGKVRAWQGPLAAGELTVGAAVALTLPTASSGEFAGVAKPEGRVLALGAFVPEALDHRLAIDVNLGGVVRATTRFANIAQRSGLAWGVGGSYRVLDELWASAELFGDVIPSGRYMAPSTPGAMVGAATTMTTIEALAGVRYQMERRVNIGLAVGRGLTSGIGSPDLRGVVLVTVAPGAADLVPIHGINNEPDRDSDGDGIPDSVDKCPHEPEDKDLFNDSDGCPDPDNDGDGIPDDKDKCPLDPEDKDGFQDDDGCPDKDNDNDGIPDAEDKCPNDPEDKDGFQDQDGCPDPDNDGDGIPDAKDKCPNEPETINGNQDDDGCPDKGDSLVVLSPDRLDLLEAIQFSGTRISKRSFNVLGQIAATLRAHGDIVRVRVTAHVQPTSNPDADLALSEKRAEAVKDWLVQWGIAAARLEARGFGGTKPLVPADQKGSAMINERLEFIILERK